MRLISSHVENFGVLSGADYEFAPGLNTLLADNGRGKSTLAAFIRVMLYGFEESARDELKNERRRYAPWQGGVYGGSLKFETGGKTYILSRTFGDRKGKDSFSLLDAETNLDSGDFSANIGAELFGLDGESFKKSVFISQNDCMSAATAGITAKLGGMAELTGDMGQYDLAQETLKNILNKLNPGRSTGSVNRLKKEISGLEAELRGAEALDARLAETAAKLEEAKDKRRAAEQKLAALRDRQDKAIEVNLLLEKKDDYLRLQKERDSRKAACDGDMAALPGGALPDLGKIEAGIALCTERSRLLSDAADLRDRLGAAEMTRSVGKPVIPALAAGLALALAGLVIAGLGVMPGLICSAVGIAAAAAAFLPMLRRHGDGGAEELREELRKKEADISKTDIRLAAVAEENGLAPEPDGLIEGLYALRSRLEGLMGDLRHAKVELERAEKELKDFEAANDIKKIAAADPSERVDTQSLVEEIRQTEGGLRDAVSEAGSIQRELDGLRASRDELDAKAAELEEKKALAVSEEHRFRLLTETKELLTKAADSLTARYMRPLLDGFRKYYGLMNGENPDAFDIDAKTGVGVNEGGRRRDLQLLSQGRRDLAGICRRMAMVDAMYRDEKPFIVLDDPFANLDGDRIEGGLRFLKEAAKDYQIIYFTCHDSRAANL